MPNIIIILTVFGKVIILKKFLIIKIIELKKLKIISKKYSPTLYSNYNFLIFKLIYNSAYIIIIIINLIIINNIINKGKIILQLPFVIRLLLSTSRVKFY